MEEQGKELEVSLGKRREFMTFAAKSSPVQNTVASSSNTPTPPVCEQRPVTPQGPIRRPPIHPLGWRRVGTRLEDLDNSDEFKWVPEHLTPRGFLDERKKVYAKAPGPVFVDYVRVPAFWTPS